MGLLKAMYSMILIMVEMSFISQGLSGFTQTSAVERISRSCSSETRPVKLNMSELLFFQHFAKSRETRPSANAGEVNIAASLIFQVQSDVEKNVEAFLNADGSHVADEKRFAVLQFGFRRNGLEGRQVGAIANYENIARIFSAAGSGEVAVAAVGGHDDVAETIGELFEPDLRLIKKILALILREV